MRLPGVHSAKKTSASLGMFLDVHRQPSNTMVPLFLERVVTEDALVRGSLRVSLFFLHLGNRGVEGDGNKSNGSGSDLQTCECYEICS